VQKCPDLVTAADHPEFAVDDRATRGFDANQHGSSGSPRIGRNVVDMEVVTDVFAIIAAGHVYLVIDYTTSGVELGFRQRRQRGAPSVTCHIIGIHCTGWKILSDTTDNVNLAIGVGMTVVPYAYRHLHPCAPAIGINVVDAV